MAGTWNGVSARRHPRFGRLSPYGRPLQVFPALPSFHTVSAPRHSQRCARGIAPDGLKLGIKIADAGAVEAMPNLTAPSTPLPSGPNRPPASGRPVYIWGAGQVGLEAR